MVDPVGPRAIASIDKRPQPVAPVSAVQAAQAPVQSETTRATSSMQALSRPAAASAPVDMERVSKIKKAIADGKFPMVPATIADRLLALKLEWTGRDAS